MSEPLRYEVEYGIGAKVVFADTIGQDFVLKMGVVELVTITQNDVIYQVYVGLEPETISQNELLNDTQCAEYLKDWLVKKESR